MNEFAFLCRIEWCGKSALYLSPALWKKDGEIHRFQHGFPQPKRLVLFIFLGTYPRYPPHYGSYC
jgi:hypothetical protein